MADKKWIQKATRSIKRRGTEGVCTGAKFGSSSCPPGSKRYNLAKTFKKMAKKPEGGEIDGRPIDLGLGQQVGNYLDLPPEKDPLQMAKALYTHFNKYPDRYEMSGESFELTPETYKKYPAFSYVKDLPVTPKRYTTGRNLQTGQDFAFPAYDMEEIASYQEMSLGGILGQTAVGAGTGALTGGGVLSVPGAIIGGGVGLVKGLMGHFQEKKAEKEEQQRLASPHTGWAMAHQNFQQSYNPYAATFPMGGLIPYDNNQANVELEKEEVFQTPDGMVGQVDGPTHAEGGVPMSLAPGTRVWSDRLKASSGKTFAEEAETIKKKIAKYEKMLS